MSLPVISGSSQSIGVNGVASRIEANNKPSGLKGLVDKVIRIWHGFIAKREFNKEYKNSQKGFHIKANKSVDEFLKKEVHSSDVKGFVKYLREKNITKEDLKNKKCGEIFSQNLGFNESNDPKFETVFKHHLTTLQIIQNKYPDISIL